MATMIDLLSNRLLPGDNDNNNKGAHVVTGEAMMGKLVELMPQTGLSAEDIDSKVKAYLGESGIDVDSAFTIGNSIVMMAVNSGEPPEQTVVGAFITGLSLGCKLGRDGMLNP